MTDAFRTIYKQEGMGAFFRGFTPCVLRAFPANAAAFVGFEMALRYLPDRLGGVDESEL
jgi:solute carrier family 25 carnitine/acylcarnitine transporter 20/29